MSEKKLLRVDASMRYEGSYSRELADLLIETLQSKQAYGVIHRDLAKGVSLIDEAWIGANFTDKAERSPEQAAALSESDALLSEVRAADVLVLAVPIYNFGVPAAMKAWIDLVCRARESFRYTENGPEGLLKGKTAYVVLTSGGTKMFSEIDFAATHLRQVMRFIGIEDVHFINAGQLMSDTPAVLADAKAQIAALGA